MLINKAKSHALCTNIMSGGRVQDVHLMLKLVPNVAQKKLCLDPLFENIQLQLQLYFI